MVTAGLEETVRLLRHRDHQPAQFGQGRWSATRAGRNDVWRIVRTCGSTESYFVKFYLSPLELRRELRGLQLAQQLADGCDWLMAADVLTVDESELFILTKALPGTPLRALIQTALRRAQARHVQRAALEQSRQSLAQVVAWINMLQGVGPQDLGDLQDDRPAAVAERVATKFERLRSGSLASSVAIPWSAPRFPSVLRNGLSVLTHGDLSFGNILCHQGRIGVVDFENMGIGLPHRDVGWIQYNLEQCNYRWYYRSSTPLLQLLELRSSDVAEVSLYRMEYVIDHLLILEARMSGQCGWRERILGRAERRWVQREFTRLSRVLAAC